MIRKVLLLSLSTAFVTTAWIESTYSNHYRTNLSSYLHMAIAGTFAAIKSNCRSLVLCRLVERFKTTVSNYDSPHSILGPHKERSEDTAIQARSYYGASSPAFYPAFDPISILASLAFLAFLLQSFAALFDRSRSIIPAVISSRDFSPEDNSPDPIELILRTLDEYAVLTNDINIDKDKPLQKL